MTKMIKIVTITLEHEGISFPNLTAHSYTNSGNAGVTLKVNSGPGVTLVFDCVQSANDFMELLNSNVQRIEND